MLRKFDAHQRDAHTISDKIVDTLTFSTPYFVTVIPFCPPSLSFQPLSPKTMLCRNCCDLGEQTSNIEWGSGVFSTFFFFAIKRVVLVGALIVLWKDNVSTNYVADCLRPICCVFAILLFKNRICG